MLTLKYLLILVASLCVLLFAIGTYKLSKEIEPNLCQMTYMLKSPIYTKVPLKRNVAGYGLYYYNEGDVIADLRALNGAPVLFVPGNGGSYKQARSLGSVALRMAMGYNKPHLDYFTIDFDEELTALYGGYLARQQRFLKQCINSIIRLYKATDKSVKRKIVIVGHSMGGVVTKSLINDAEWRKKIAVIIFMSAPLDQPVIYVDKEIDHFYQYTNRLATEDERVLVTESTSIEILRNSTNIADILLISIGGGNRDELVHASLTESSVSDLHVITTAIPNVWVTCDHLAAMWCLQLMKVVNKFLLGITFQAAEGLTFFDTNAKLNLQTAQHYFIGAHTDSLHDETKEFPVQNYTATVGLHFYKIFEHGIPIDYQQAVLYSQVAPYENIYIAVTHESTNHQWLFGCQQNKCETNEMLTQQIRQLPSKRGHKTYALLNLAAIFSTFTSWTHLLIRLDATIHYAALYIDVHNSDERSITFKAPQFYEFMPKKLSMPATAQSEQQMFRRFQIQGLTAMFYAFKLKFDFTVNGNLHKNDYENIVKISAPWAASFDRYYTLTAAQTLSHELIIQLPKQESNTSKTFNSLLYVDVHTDPWCNLDISYHFTLAETMRNMVQQYYHGLPAHMSLIMISSLGCQFRNTYKDKHYFDFLQLKSWYIVITMRLASGAVSALPFLPQELMQHSKKQYSWSASLIVHGYAMGSCVVLALVIRLHIDILSKLQAKATLPDVSIPKLHIVFAIVTACISMAFSKCVSLAIMFMVYMFIVAIANKKENRQVTNTEPTLERDENEKPKNSDVDTTDSGDIFSKSSSNATKNYSKDGFHNLGFHVNLLALIILLIVVNIGDTIAWYKSLTDNNAYHSIQTFTSLLFTPVVFVICCLPLLWHLNAPTNTDGTPVYTLLLNSVGAMSLLLCDEKLYRVNYIVAFVVALLSFRELLSKRY